MPTAVTVVATHSEGLGYSSVVLTAVKCPCTGLLKLWRWRQYLSPEHFDTHLRVYTTSNPKDTGQPHRRKNLKSHKLSASHKRPRGFIGYKTAIHTCQAYGRNRNRSDNLVPQNYVLLSSKVINTPRDTSILRFPFFFLLYHLIYCVWSLLCV